MSLELGTRVTFDMRDALARTSDWVQPDPTSRGKMVKVWRPVAWVPPEPVPTEGIVIGTRTYSDGGWEPGSTDYFGEVEDGYYKPIRHYQVVLVAYHLKRVPVALLPEHVTLVEES